MTGRALFVEVATLRESVAESDNVDRYRVILSIQTAKETD
jgi:hypothetical protein